jgi:hypothetical protein
MDARSLRLWIGDHHGALLDQPSDDVVGSVGIRLANAARNLKTIQRARRELGLGVELEVEAWRNQARDDHRLRRQPFSSLGYDVRDVLGRPRLAIDDRRLTDSQVSDYATAVVDAQVRVEPTIFQTPGHLVAGPIGLTNDIMLAHAVLDLADRRALREPAAGDVHNRPRAVFASINVRVPLLTPERIRALVNAYSPLDVDGFSLAGFDFAASGVRTELFFRLALALQENSGNPVDLAGVGHLWQAATARGIAAANAGPDRGQLLFQADEAPPKPRNPDDEDEGKRQVPIYRCSILGCFAVGQRGDDARRDSFRRSPCQCGFHQPELPPVGRREAIAHNHSERLEDARDACQSSAAMASARLASRLPAARTERVAVGIKGLLPVGWARATSPWPGLDIGWGAAEGLG